MLRSRAGRVTVGAAGRANPQSISFCGRLHEADGLSEQQETRSGLFPLLLLMALLFGPSLARETEFLGQRQTARKGAGDQGMALGRQNLLAEPRRFGANRRVRGNLR